MINQVEEMIAAVERGIRPADTLHQWFPQVSINEINHQILVCDILATITEQGVIDHNKIHDFHPAASPEMIQEILLKSLISRGHYDVKALSSLCPQISPNLIKDEVKTHKVNSMQAKINTRPSMMRKLMELLPERTSDHRPRTGWHNLGHGRSHTSRGRSH